MVKLESMTEDQVKQVVSSGTIRSVGDQRIYIESQKRKQEIKPYNGNDYYRTEKGKLHILAPVTLSKRQLRNILNDL